MMLPSYYQHLSRAERGGIRPAVTWSSSHPAHPWPSGRARSGMFQCTRKTRLEYSRCFPDSRSGTRVTRWTSGQPSRYCSHLQPRASTSIQLRYLPQLGGGAVQTLPGWAFALQRPWASTREPAATAGLHTRTANTHWTFVPICFAPASPSWNNNLKFVFRAKIETPASHSPHPATLKPFNFVPKYIHQAAVRQAELHSQTERSLTVICF